MLLRKGSGAARKVVTELSSKKVAFEQTHKWSQKASPCGSSETSIALQTSGSAHAEPPRQGVLRCPSRGMRPGMREVMQERSSGGKWTGMRRAVQLGPELWLLRGSRTRLAVWGQTGGRAFVCGSSAGKKKKKNMGE